ncbi:MAG: hypothetical protein GJ680_18485 [Alteromonadaceae bacterium]|nr:hypothetical protein [Alteromonadaceae bacterium]
MYKLLTAAALLLSTQTFAQIDLDTMGMQAPSDNLLASVDTRPLTVDPIVEQKASTVMAMEPAQDLLSKIQCPTDKVPALRAFEHTMNFEYRLAEGQLLFAEKKDMCPENYQLAAGFCISVTCQ